MVPISPVAEYMMSVPCWLIVKFSGRLEIDANCLTSPSVVFCKCFKCPMINSSPEIPDSVIFRKSVGWSYEYPTPETLLRNTLIPTGTNGLSVPYFPFTMALSLSSAKIMWLRDITG